MGWEVRSGRKYFYQKIRIGRRVISHYLGTDILALLVETEVEQSRIENLRDKLTKATGEKVLRTLRDGNQQALEAEHLIQAILQSALIITGHHTHKRQWRRKRWTKQ